MKKRTTTTAQQGDVLLRKLTDMPIGAKLVGKNNLVLAEGETTGHAHRISLAGSEMFQAENRMFIKLVNATTITHEEHKPITLEPGIWEVGRVQEWDYLSQMARRVED